jgi:hypothetical protein
MIVVNIDNYFKRSSISFRGTVFIFALSQPQGYINPGLSNQAAPTETTFILMKRRTFVRTAALGALGLGVNTGLFAANGNNNSKARVWLQQLTDLIDARPQRKALSSPDSFLQLAAQLNKYFSERGYSTQFDSRFYFYGPQQNCCLFPLELRHARSGTSDFVAPVLRLNAQQEWEHFHTMTGFELEALVHASKALLKTHPETVAALLMPDPARTSNMRKPHYDTAAGTVHVTTQMQANKSRTYIQVTNKGNAVFTDTFESGHCLYTAAQVGA